MLVPKCTAVKMDGTPCKNYVMGSNTAKFCSSHQDLKWMHAYEYVVEKNLIDKTNDSKLKESE
jgi:hypothetical protein